MMVDNEGGDFDGIPSLKPFSFAKEFVWRKLFVKNLLLLEFY